MIDIPQSIGGQSLELLACVDNNRGLSTSEIVKFTKVIKRHELQARIDEVTNCLSGYKATTGLETDPFISSMEAHLANLKARE